MQKEISIGTVKISYIVAGKGETILFLHGWGCSKEIFQSTFDYLKPFYQVCAVDMPGFGESCEPDKPWGVEEYADLITLFIRETGLSHLTIVGHSFGGRVAIKLAAQKRVNIKKIVLVNSAGVKPKRFLDYYIKVYLYKLFKKVAKMPLLSSMTLLKKRVAQAGSEDYRNASDAMKKTMVKVINEDLTKDMPLITEETLLIWGGQDRATPLSDAKKMEKLIPNSGLVLFKSAGHYSFLDEKEAFNHVLKYFVDN